MLTNVSVCNESDIVFNARLSFRGETDIPSETPHVYPVELQQTSRDSNGWRKRLRAACK